MARPGSCKVGIQERFPDSSRRQIPSLLRAQSANICAAWRMLLNERYCLIDGRNKGHLEVHMIEYGCLVSARIESLTIKLLEGRCLI